jgi:electron transfer flavoprotein alpha subunit
MTAQDVWVVGELRDDAPSAWTLELVSGAAALAAELGSTVHVLLPSCDEDAALELAAHGAGSVTTIVDAPALVTVETVEAAARAIVERDQPGCVIFADSRLGRDAASQLAAASGVALISGCERLAPAGESGLRAIRGCFGGQFASELESDGPLAVVTVSEHAFRARRTLDGGAVDGGAVERSTVSIYPAAGIDVLERRAGDPDTLALTEADVLVGGGRGVGPEGFGLLMELARSLGGTVAASRAAVDEGWVPRDKQVGQTGQRVAPRLYVACGISGALQHMVGVRDAGSLVALNTDAKAPIMAEADLAVVGDASEVMPRLLQRIGAGGDA